MRIFRLILAMSLLLAVSLPARAASSFADEPHVHVQLVVPVADANRGNVREVGLYFKLETGWHIYWLNPGDAGEPPHVKWTLPEGITAGLLHFPTPKRLPLGPLMDYGYENEVLYPIDVKVAANAPLGLAKLDAKVDWLVCSSSCIPGKAELETALNITAFTTSTQPGAPGDKAIWNTLAGKLPKTFPTGANVRFQSSSNDFRLTVETGQRELSAEFFPEDQDIIDNPAPQKLTPTATGLILDLKKDASLSAAPKQLRGVLELSGGRAYEIVALPGTVAAAEVQAPATQAASDSTVPVATNPPANQTPAQQNSKSLLLPCGTGQLAQVRKDILLTLFRISGLAFLGGLILNLMPCVFPVLFLKGLALVNSGNEERAALRMHGLVYAAGILVSFWVLVGVLLGLRAAGATLGWGFQFQSPIFLALMAGLLFFLGLSLAGQFEIGLTMTSAGGSLAQKQGLTGSFFTGVLAVVVATPCTAPFMGAAIGYALAQSAAVTFAIFTALALGLAAPYVALTLQPAWTRWLPKPGAWMEVLRQAVAVPIFATVIWLAWVLAQAYGASVLAALLASFLLLAIAGWFLGRWPAKRWATVVAALILVGVVALAVIGQRWTSESNSTGKAEPAVAAHGVWEPWSAEAVSRYQSQGRPVFVDFTASWCLSCQVNERAALNRPEVQQAFQAANVALLKADWTRHDEAITQALTALGRSGVPAYALYAPGQSQPQMLPEVLTPGIVTDALSRLRPAH
ncbi:MAG: thioredoxin family protein [Terracidiphilus sp.]|jgi:thiol:disulfide interchange protein DsbD